MIPLILLNLLATSLLSVQIDALIEAEKPEPLSDPYTPPYTGGQCITGYYIDYEWRQFATDGSLILNWRTSRAQELGRLGEIRAMNFDAPIGSGANGAGITILTLAHTDTPVRVRILHGFQVQGALLEIRNIIVTRIDSLSDNCGNLPNPNPPSSTIPDSGAGNPPANEIEGDEYIPIRIHEPEISEGGAIVPALSALQAAIAAAALAASAISAATTVAELAAAIANALGKLLDADNKARELEEEKEKQRKRENDKEKKREIWLQRLGSTKGDGLLSLVPRNNDSTVELISVEVQFPNIPASIGKYFGRDSPNRYPYEMGLGYIAFYGLGGGVIESHRLEFRRNNINVPPNTMGLIYHFGLTNQLVANISLYYYREVQS